MKKCPEGGVALGHLIYFSNFGTPNISGTAEDTILNFCSWIEGEGTDTKQKNAKLVKTGRGLGHVQHLGPVIF